MLLVVDSLTRHGRSMSILQYLSKLMPMYRSSSKGPLQLVFAFEPFMK
jgi:hypothetical protein